MIRPGVILLTIQGRGGPDMGGAGAGEEHDATAPGAHLRRVLGRYHVLGLERGLSVDRCRLQGPQRSVLPPPPCRHLFRRLLDFP